MLQQRCLPRRGRGRCHRLDLQQRRLVLVGQQVQKPVRPLPDIADPLVQFPQQPPGQQLARDEPLSVQSGAATADNLQIEAVPIEESADDADAAPPPARSPSAAAPAGAPAPAAPNPPPVPPGPKAGG